MTPELIKRLEQCVKDKEEITITWKEANSILWGNTEYLMSQVPAMAELVHQKMMTGEL